MPPPQIKEESRVFGEAAKKPKKAANRKSATVKQSEQDLLFDLMGDSDMPAADLSATLNGSQNNSDLLADILGGGHSSVSSTPVPQQSNMNSIMDLFGSSGSSQPATVPQSTSADLFSTMSSPPPTQATPVAAPGHPCYKKNDLNVTLQLQRNSEGIILITARFSNTSLSQPKMNVGLQAAVPKTQKLQLNAISNADLGPGAEATQTMRVSGSKGVSCSSIPIVYLCEADCVYY
jgi:AP-1 complex subunit gamma-1